MNKEEIDIKDIEFGEPIEEREPTYRDGYIRGIYRARNIIDSKQKEIERLNNIINEYTKWLNEQVDYMTHHSIERMVAFDCCRHKLQELKGSNLAIPPEVIGTNGEDGGVFDYGDR